MLQDIRYISVEHCVYNYNLLKHVQMSVSRVNVIVIQTLQNILKGYSTFFGNRLILQLPQS